MLQNVQNLIGVLAKSHQCPHKCRNVANRVCDITRGVCDDTTFSFKEPHAIGVLNNYSAFTNSGDIETEVLEW